MKSKFLFTATSALLLSAATLFGAPYQIDPSHSSVSFKVKHMMISNVSGNFGDFSGHYDLEKGTLKALEGTIKVASIDTGITKRDDHLKSADFFDVAKYPEMTFVMHKFHGSGVTGDLTLHGVTKSVTLDAEVSGQVKDPWGNTRSALSLTGKIKRSDFGLTWNKALETGGVVVGDSIKLDIELEGIAK